MADYSGSAASVAVTTGMARHAAAGRPGRVVAARPGSPRRPPGPRHADARLWRPAGRPIGWRAPRGIRI